MRACVRACTCTCTCVCVCVRVCDVMYIHIQYLYMYAQYAYSCYLSHPCRIKVIKLPFSLSTFYVDQSETQYVSCVKLDVNVRISQCVN